MVGWWRRQKRRYAQTPFPEGRSLSLSSPLPKDDVATQCRCGEREEGDGRRRRRKEAQKSVLLWLLQSVFDIANVDLVKICLHIVKLSTNVHKSFI